MLESFAELYKNARRCPPPSWSTGVLEIPLRSAGAAYLPRGETLVPTVTHSQTFFVQQCKNFVRTIFLDSFAAGQATAVKRKNAPTLGETVGAMIGIQGTEYAWSRK